MLQHLLIIGFIILSKVWKFTFGSEESQCVLSYEYISFLPLSLKIFLIPPIVIYLYSINEKFIEYLECVFFLLQVRCGPLFRNSHSLLWAY